MADEVTTQEPQTLAGVPPVDPMQEAERDESGMLTHEGMLSVLRAGGSVILNGSIITDPRNLPSEAQLAKGNAAKEAQARQNLDAQIARLQAEKAVLAAGPTPAVTTRSEIPTNDFGFPEGTQEQVGNRLEGDTAGADGDRGDPNTPAGKAHAAQREEESKAQAEGEEAALKEAEEAAKAEAEAEDEQKKAIAEEKKRLAAEAKKSGEGK